jgi:hypothetical protein
MSFTLTAFRELAGQFPNWEDLKSYLLSKEGGSLRVVDGAGPQCIIRYTKGVSDFNVPHVGLFRSVVWNKETNRPVSVAPVKALPGPAEEGANVQVSDFVDGVMIQAWRSSGHVRIATRTSLDARGTFYSEKSFAQLLEDALRTFSGTQAFLKSVLEEGMFCSLVLQHRDHKTVAPVPYPRVFVTQVGHVAADGQVTVHTDCSLWPQRLQPLAPHVHCTVVADGETKKMLHTGRENYQWQGLVFQEVGTARRWRLRNPNYVAVRTLRGAEASAVGRFVRLRGDGTMKEYLKYFREESSEMWKLEQLLRERTQELYNAYNAVHKAKDKGLKDLPYSLRPHVYALHGLYLKGVTTAPADTQEQQTTSILKSRVIDYVNNLAREDQVRLLEGDRVAPAPRPTVS